MTQKLLRARVVNTSLGEGLQARPCNAGGSAVRGGSGLEALTHWPAAISGREEYLSYIKFLGQPTSLGQRREVAKYGATTAPPPENPE